jgi:hypothetical protein
VRGGGHHRTRDSLLVRRLPKTCFHLTLAGLVLLLAGLASIASAQVWPLERGQAAPASGILLDDPTAARAAEALQQAERLQAQLELLTAKLSESDARTADLLAQVDVLTQAAATQAAQVAELKAALDRSAEREERSAERDERLATLLEETSKTLAASRKQLAAVGHKSFWSYIIDGFKIVAPLLSLLLLAAR